MIPLGFERPEFLWLLLLAVPIFGLGRWSRRRIGPVRRGLALSLRLALLATIVMALAGLTYLQAVDALGVVFVLDRSASVGGAGQAQAERFIQQALTHQTSEDRAGIVVFGAEGMVEVEPKLSLRFHGIDGSPSPHQSDLAAGLRLGTALLPSDRAGRVVLLTDGEQTRGDAATQALLTAGEDLQISVVKIGGTRGPDVVLEDLIAPNVVEEGAAYEVRVLARAESPTKGTLRMYRNADYLGAMEVEVGSSSVFTFRQHADTSGLVRFRATFEPTRAADDSIPQNNQVMSTVQVDGRPTVLIVSPELSRAQPLAAVLRGDGIGVEVRLPEEFPPGLAGLRPFAAVFIADVPAYMLSGRQQRAVESYVRDLGRGLVMIGGENSFGVGGYYKTPIERALPVGMDIEDKTRFPKLGMVHAMDKSGSMSGTPLDLAKEAAIQTVELLSERDLLGVIGFDGAASFIVPFEELHDKQRVIDDISSVRAGGGTDIYPALDRSFTALADSDAALKHVILLSDGLTSSGAYENLIRDAHDTHQITLTSIGVGSGADRKTMEEFAAWGGGNYYLVTDPSAIPAIFTRETLLATRSFLNEEEVRAAAGAESELTTGFNYSRAPALHGYVSTSPKKRASVDMVIPRDEDYTDPLLAHWRYGLGRSVAWTSDAEGRWAERWVGTARYTALWTQISRYVVSSGDQSNLQLHTEIREGTLEVMVDAFDPLGGFQNFLDGEARVVAPDLSVHPLKLRQVGPGRYRASLPVDQDGSWLVGVALSRSGELVGQSVEEAVQPYSPEYRARGGGESLLVELGRIGGGGLISDPERVFQRPPVARKIPHPLWSWLMGLAAVLLVLDVASRRLDLSTGGTPVVLVPVARARPARTPVRRSAAAAVEEVPIEEEPPNTPQIDPNSYAGRLLAARQAARDRLDDT